MSWQRKEEGNLMEITIAEAIKLIEKSQSEKDLDSSLLQGILSAKISYKRNTINVKIKDVYFNINDLFKILNFIRITDKTNPLIKFIKELIWDNYLTKTIDY